MSAPRFSRASRRDLDEILDRIAIHNSRAAVAFVERLEKKCYELAENPDMGFLRDELAPDLRCWPVRKYLIFYRPIDDGIEIVRVVHGARDLDRLFGHE